MPEKKLTKREKKAAAFRNRKKESDALSEANAVPESDVKEDQPQEVATTQQKTDRSSTKRANDDAQQDKPAKKKRRSRGGKGNNNEGGDKKRFILFVGNLPKDTTSQELAAHFESVGELPTVRLMTHKETNEPKGFAFVEFKDSETLNVSAFVCVDRGPCIWGGGVFCLGNLLILPTTLRLLLHCIVPSSRRNKSMLN